MNHTIRVLAATLATALVAGSAEAARVWYLLLEGDQGPISAHSGTTTSGLTNQTELIAYGQNFFLPLNTSGPPGPLEFRPLRVVKGVDGSSPRIAKAVATSEAITSCVLTLYETSPSPVALYQIEVLGAQLIGVSGGGDSNTSVYSAGTETVSILFQSLKSTDLLSGQTSTIP